MFDVLWIATGLSLQPHPTVTRDRMKFGGLDKAILALYISDEWQDNLDDDGTWPIIQEQIVVAKRDFPGNFIALEGGRCLGSDPVTIQLRLKQLMEAGIKYLTLVHNNANLLAGSSTDAAGREKGLSRLGHDVVEECEDSGVLVDVSHASDATIAEVVAIARKPVIASHSGCKMLLHHPRNLTDHQINAIAGTGGMVCVPFARRFVGTMAGVAAHVDHVCQVTGSLERVGIGSDLDGAKMVDGVMGAEDWSKVVVDQLARRGFSDTHIAKIAGGNLLRLLETHSGRH